MIDAISTQLLSKDSIIVIQIFIVLYSNVEDNSTFFFLFIRVRFIQMFRIHRSVVVFLFILFISATTSSTKQTNLDCIINELKIPENLLYKSQSVKHVL